MNQIYLSLGTNLGKRQHNLQNALLRLQEEVVLTGVSPIYETDPWGNTDQPQFLNLCVSAQTALQPKELLTFVKQIEQDMGREEITHWGPRLIDIDILFHNETIWQDEDLIIPHPHIAERAFVLAPLTDIAPDFTHPQTGETVVQMLANVFTTSVRKLSNQHLAISN